MMMWLVLGSSVALVLALLMGGLAYAADQSKVNHATKEVTTGADEIGYGYVGAGFKDLFTGIGHTIVEGAKFSGETVKESLESKPPQKLQEPKQP